MSPPSQLFPFDLFAVSRFQNDSRDLTKRITELSELCLSPSYPWGHWLFGKLIERQTPWPGGEFVECGVARGGTALFFGEYAREERFMPWTPLQI
jgi:hypothetical protein